MAMKNKNQKGFALLIAVIFMSVMLALGLALGSLGYKQQVLSSSAIESQYAFYAADAAQECALEKDQMDGTFFVNPSSGSVLPCDDATFPITMPLSSWMASGGTVYAVSSIPNISLDDGARCASVTIYKPPLTSTSPTYIFSQGYDVPCASIVAGARFVSRGISTYH